MYAFVDVETTGFACRGVQPRIVSIAWMIADNPRQARTFKYSVVRPDGFTIPNRAAAIHGITTSIAHAEGKSIVAVLADFARDLVTLKPKAIVAHNSNFDLPVIEAEFQQLGLHNPCAKLTVDCTMLRARSKWPGYSAKLCDVYSRIFSKPLENAHNAGGDVWACSQVFFYLN